jgi:hypothetical protein
MKITWNLLAAAALSGAAAAALDSLSGGSDRIYEHAVIGAIIGVAGYLKQSPLPPNGGK